MGIVYYVWGNMSIFNGLVELVNKDTILENESKKMTVLIRKLTLIIIAFLMFSIAFCAVAHVENGIAFSIMFVILFLIVLCISYYASREKTVWSFIVSAVVWSVGSLWLYGWYCGVQTFLLLVLLIYYFAVYNRLFAKVVFSSATFAIYMAMYFVFAQGQIQQVLEGMQQLVIRCSYMAVLITCISLVGYTFSNDRQAMEIKLVEYNKKLEEKASTDPLTGLFNRGKGMEILNKLIERADIDIFSLCICDIDFFKRVNDNYGHDVGDEVLKEVADVLTSTMADSGIVSRWGGEEFMLIFPKLNGDFASTVVYKIQSELRKRSIVSGGETINVTLTFGLTEYDDNLSLAENLKDADNKLYQGKEQGRNRLVY